MSEWYDYQDIDSYNALFNTIIGARGDGKTFGWKKKAILGFIKSAGKKQGLYMRRTESEISEARQKFDEDLDELNFPDYRFRVKSEGLEICQWDNETNERASDWDICINFAYLANAEKYKSVSYHRVSTICYDEVFIREGKRSHYLAHEVRDFFHFYETVARGRDVTVYFLSNAISKINPYFVFFGIIIRDSKPKIIRAPGKPDYVVQVVDDTEYRKTRQKTRFGQLIAGSDFEKNAFGNEFNADTQSLRVGKKPRNAYNWLNLKFGEDKYAIYCDDKEDLIYISNSYNEQNKKVIEFIGGRVKKSMLPGGRRMQFEILVNYFNRGKMVFENMDIQRRFSEIMFMG